jgi:hypothetical protein
MDDLLYVIETMFLTGEIGRLTAPTRSPCQRFDAAYLRKRRQQERRSSTMATHIPRLCDRCGSPMTARRECTHCGHAAQAPRRRDPLDEIREALMPWIRGQMRCW